MIPENRITVNTKLLEEFIPFFNMVSKKAPLIFNKSVGAFLNLRIYQALESNVPEKREINMDALNQLASKKGLKTHDAARRIALKSAAYSTQEINRMLRRKIKVKTPYSKYGEYILKTSGKGNKARMKWVRLKQVGERRREILERSTIKRLNIQALTVFHEIGLRRKARNSVRYQFYSAFKAIMKNAKGSVESKSLKTALGMRNLVKADFLNNQSSFNFRDMNLKSKHTWDMYVLINENKVFGLYKLGDEEGGSGWNNQKNLRCVDEGIERYLAEDMEHYGDRVAQAVMEGIQ